MAYFLFVDESGQDRRDSPYEVLAGIAIRDSDLWSIIGSLHEAELRHFGRRYSAGPAEIKGKKILKTKVFQHARLNAMVAPAERSRLAKEALDSGATATVVHLKALAQAKLGYVSDVFDLCATRACRAFASIVDPAAQPTTTDGLRKDYAYLFERFFYYLEDVAPSEQGIIVFDELDKAQSHILIDQCHKYFRDSFTGRTRSARIVPEPFFVHSELTTGIQIADLVAYTISWGFRTPRMAVAARAELAPYADQVSRLRYRTTRERAGNPSFEIWSFAYITDLRTRLERAD